MQEKGTLLAAGIILIFGGIVAYRFVNETKQALASAQRSKQPWEMANEDAPNVGNGYWQTSSSRTQPWKQ